MRQRFLKRLIFLFVPMLTSVAASAQNDSLSDSLRASSVMAARAAGLAIPNAGGVSLDMAEVKALPMLLGTPDPLGLAHYLPSMSIQSELEAGIHIQGNDHSHNLVSSGDVPIYGATHLLGLFSVFNPTHFTRLDYSTRTPERNRLGGTLDMPLPREGARRPGGEASLGLMSAQGTLRLPLGKTLSATLSARRSFLNLLYGPFLVIEKERVKYGFTDVNLTLLWQPSSRDKVWLDAYYGGDAASMNSAKYAIHFASAWQNAMAALHWEHAFEGGGTLRQSLYYTLFSLDLDVDWTGVQGALPSFLHTAGYRARWNMGDWTASAESAWHRNLRQSPSVQGDFNGTYTPQPVQHAWENTFTGFYSPSWGRYSLVAGFKGSVYRTPEGGWYARWDPQLRAGVDFYRAGRLEAGVDLSHQYLFQAGFTDVGLPTEYWFVASDLHAPQQALSLSASYTLRLGKDGRYRLSAEAYCKWLGNQIEYKGNLMALANTAYDPESVLLTGKGRAYGVNLSLYKTAGALTGWVSYAWGRSLRQFDHPAYPGEYPAGFERIHELDAVGSWHLGRWALGASFVAATGTPFTAPEQVYLLGHQLVASFGEHNGHRLAPYVRLDLSVSYFFRKGNGINFTLYNATGHWNELCYQLRADEKEGFLFGPMDFNVRFMPSLCYFHKF